MVNSTFSYIQSGSSLPYPKLRLSDTGDLVFFIDSASGVVVLSAKCESNPELPNAKMSYPVGTFSGSWDSSRFTDFFGIISLDMLNSFHEKDQKLS